MCKISSTFYEENAKFIFTFSLSQESNFYFLHFASELKIQKFSSEFVREREREEQQKRTFPHQRILHRAPQKEGCK
jgi:hypothetical protein